MRSGIIAAAVAAFAVASATSAQAEDWCGYAAHDNAVIECGYSTVADCQTTVGKGGMCFIDPDYALRSNRAMPVVAAKRSAARG